MNHVDSAETRGKSTDLGLRWEKNLQEWGGEEDKGGKGEKTGVRKLKVKKGKENKRWKKRKPWRMSRISISNLLLKGIDQVHIGSCYCEVKGRHLGLENFLSCLGQSSR